MSSNDFDTQRDQRGSELAGSGAEIEHARAGRALERPAHCGPRVVRTMLGVCDRRRAERRGMKQPFMLVADAIGAAGGRPPRLTTSADGGGAAR
ncbi:hypothetical protein [Streptomyces himastatinicus]|uniref:hypothetical protein n=1 Tax=Streptomyces himastatinicus TaxID=998084 RepID=UPI00315C54AD